MIKEQDNLKNMMQCLRFESCSIPKCPLDYYMKERVELPEDNECPLTRLLVVGKRRKRIEGILSAQMKALLRLVPSRNQKMP
jgi:hypothetical protein